MLPARSLRLSDSRHEMPPHGRRRLSSLTIILSLAFFFISTASAASAVLGIDLGTEYIKAALVKPGIPLEIVLTKDSKRKESAAVAFKPSRSTSDTKTFPERVYGGDALALFARFPSDVYPNLKPLLGQQFKKNNAVSDYRKRFPELRVLESKDRGTVGFRSLSFDQAEEAFLVEELLAMELKNIRSNAVALAGKGSIIQDAVITIPPYYTAEEKRAVILSAELAGLRVLSLISDGLAIGLNYATSRSFPTINDGGKPEIHLVYDMGAGSATATVLKFQGRTVKDVGKYNKTIQEVHILGTGSSKSLNGDALNQVILDDMIDKFAETSRMKTLGAETRHIKAHGRTMAKLWKESERLRQVLSANTETQASFEGLYYDDVNFKYKITRAEFEKLASRFAIQVQTPITLALDSAKLTLSDLESVILHGGAVRTPFVQKELEIAIGNSEKIRTNVNSDEAAVFGAAFKAAGISPSFRVKEIRTQDTAGYVSGATWTWEEKEKQQKLFTPTSTIGAEKQVSFKFSEDFTFDLFQQTKAQSGNAIDTLISRIQTKNLTASVKQLEEKFGCAVADISTKFAIRLSPVDGLPEVIRGSVSCEATAEKKGGVVDGMKDLFGFGSKKGDQKPLAEGNDAEISSSSAETEIETASSPSSSPKESKTGEPSDKKAEEKPKEAKRRTETIHLDFTTELAGLAQLSPENLDRIKERLTAFDSSDRSRIRREETFNNLEAFTYKARDLLEDEGFMSASTEGERVNVEEQFNKASEWLYGEGADASRDVLKERLDRLRGLTDPIQKRKDEALKRPKEIKSLQEALDQVKVMVDVVIQQREAASIAEEQASSSSASSLSSAEAQASASDSSTASASSTTPVDDFADLDDDPVTSSATSTTSSPTPKPPPIPNYTEEDLNSLLSTRDAVQSWLDEKISAQDKLSATDDPVLLSSDLATKSKELNQVVMNLLQRQMKAQKPPKSTKAKKAKKTKTAAAPGEKGSMSSVNIDDLLKDMPASEREEIEAAVRQAGMRSGGPEGEKGKETGKAGGDDKGLKHEEL